MSYSYRGATTKTLYSFLSPLTDSNGNPVVGGDHSVTTYNGETVVLTNRDGSVQMSTAGAGVQVASSQAGLGTNTLPSIEPSPWERYSSS